MSYSIYCISSCYFVSFVLISVSIFRRYKKTYKINIRNRVIIWVAIVGVIRLVSGVVLLVVKSNNNIDSMLSIYEFSDFLACAFAMMTAGRSPVHQSHQIGTLSNILDSKYNVLVYIFCCTVLVVVGFLEVYTRVLVYSSLEMFVSVLMILFVTMKLLTDVDEISSQQNNISLAFRVSYYLMFSACLISSIINMCMVNNYLSLKRCIAYSLLSLTFPVSTFSLSYGNSGDNPPPRMTSI